LWEFQGLTAKVLLIIDKLSTGGTQRHILNLLRYGNRREFPSDVLCLMRRGELAAEAEATGARVVSLGMKKLFRAEGAVGFARLVRFIRAGAYDIVVTHLFASNVFGAPAARLAGAQVVIGSRRQAARLAAREIRSLRRFGNRFMTHTVANCEAVRRFVVTDEGLAPEKVSVVYGGVDTELFASARADEDLFARLGLMPRVPVVASIARLSREKGLETLLDAFLEVRRRGRDCQLLLVGDGPLRNRLDERVRSLKMGDRIKFAGVREDVPAILALVDIFVLASFSEGLSNALMEASAAGRAIVATNVGGNPEIIEHGKTGILVKPADVGECADAIEKMLVRADLRERLGLSARERVRASFDVRSSVARMERLYRTLLGKQQRKLP